MWWRRGRDFWMGGGWGRGRGWCWSYFTGYPQPKLEVRPELEEKVQKIYELLPKLDCGACGYNGCYEMAIAIAEGRERQSTKEYVHFLHIAKGSCAELETQVIISKELDYTFMSSGNIMRQWAGEL